MNQRKLRIAVVGLHFGGSFVTIYHNHPSVAQVKVYDLEKTLCEEFVRRGDADGYYNSFEEILSDPECDAVHLVTPIPFHAKQTIDVLNAGKHCACAVPMATSIEEMYEIAEAKRRSGKNYMMMETTLYTYQFMYVREMVRRGEMGRLQFLRGSHYQDMRNAPSYWRGLPPMWYGTHAIAPLVVLSGSRICRVNCFGSGSMDQSLQAQYGNPFPVESSLLEFENGLKGEATRSLFECARPYQEGMFVYGSKAHFEWGYEDQDAPYLSVFENEPLFDGAGLKAYTRILDDLPNPYEALPKSIQRYTVGWKFDPENPEESLRHASGGPHHGSHPHLVHEFICSILEEREPWINLELAANITGAGVCSHISALNGGAAVAVPHIR